MSPLLFTIGMNILSCLFSRHDNNFKHHWKCKGMKLTHLFFANDVLLFSHGDIDSIHHIMHCISRFSSFSGLHPSIHKSIVFLSNCSAEVTTWFDSTYGIPHGSLPVKFLGVPLISSKLSINECMPLVDRITCRINSGTSLLLSLAGRVQLIRALLMSI